MVKAWLDHLVIGAPDLASGVAQFRELTGIEPTPGGRHPGGGTENALVALGPGLYLEIVAPVAGGAHELAPIFRHLRTVDRLTPINWAIAVDDAEGLTRQLRDAGADPQGPSPGSRRTPAGDLLSWQLFRFPLETWPFFIEWSAGTPHPASTSVGGCRLVSFTVRDPRAKELGALIGRLDLVHLVAANEPAQIVVLESPNGQVALHGP